MTVVAGLSVRDACTLVKSVRPIVEPNHGFMNELVERFDAPRGDKPHIDDYVRPMKADSLVPLAPLEEGEDLHLDTESGLLVWTPNGHVVGRQRADDKKLHLF